MARDKGKKVVEKKGNALRVLKVEYVAVDAIKPNSYNPNRQNPHDFELLCKSMREDGFTQPIIVQGESMTIVDGEHRLRAAIALGLKEVPIVKVDMTPEQMRIATLRHNRARGDEDLELTAQLLRDLQELGAIDWAQDSLMMDDEEVNRMIEEIKAPEALAGAEYGDGWKPQGVGEAPIETGAALRGDTGAQTVGDRHEIALSGKAAETIRDREKRIKEAKDEGEKAMIRRDTQIYRINLVFSGEEAKVVKSVLGKAPAEAVLRLCREELVAEGTLEEVMKDGAKGPEA